MTISKHHAGVSATIPLHPLSPEMLSATEHHRRNLGPDEAARTERSIVNRSMAASPRSPSARVTTGVTPASQPEFYLCFGLAWIALIAISILVAARG